MSVRQGNVIIAGGNSVTVDQALNINSPNAIANSAVTAGLNGKEPTITGAATTITSNNLDVARAVITDANGKIAASTVTSTELGYIHGVTSDVQTQINAKANDNAVVHLADAETITGTKTFNSTIESGVGATGTALRFRAAAGTNVNMDLVQAYDSTTSQRVATIRALNEPNRRAVILGVDNFNNGTPTGVMVNCDSNNNITTTAPTPAAGKNNTEIATTAWVTTALSGKADTATTLSGYGITDGANTNLSNLTTTGKVTSAHLAMPSNRYVNLTLPASGGTITAPADGYIHFAKNATAANQRVKLYADNIQMAVASWSTGVNNIEVLLPVSKGETVGVVYNAGGTTNFFRFTYANGAQ